jgi:acetyl-CoA acetyltransferase
MGMKDAAAIVGIGTTRYGRGLAEEESELAGQAILAALADAGIAPGEVDGLSSYTLETTNEDVVAAMLGLGDVRFFARSPFGGGGGCGTVMYAAMAIATGQADVVVAWRSRKRAAKSSRPWAGAGQVAGGDSAFTLPYGLIRPADQVAMTARRYMHETGATRDHLANVALACRRHAQANPDAQMRKPMSRGDYHAARMISDPLGLFDCCLETDGAAAVVLVSAERARDCRTMPVYIHAAAQGLSDGCTSMTNYFGPDPLRGPGKVCGDALWARSDIGPADIDTAQIYDAFTPLVLISLEAYGFCARGEGGAFSENGALEIGGRLPVNTSGGGLSEAYLHGINLIVEGVRQMRGASTNQVPDARSCLVTSGEGVPTSALVLRR